jgi:hypothetical protein
MDEAPEQSTAVVVENDYRLTVERRSEGSIIRLLDGAGGEPLRITFGPEGPVLSIGTGLAIHVAGNLSFAAERVAFHGREGVELTTGGDMLVRCEGDLVSEAREQRMCARLGDVRVEANDDVRMLGERIRLNC